MMSNNAEKLFCKRLTYIDENRQPHTLLGIILSEDDYFVKFKTRNRELSIAKKFISVIESTQQEFEEAEDDKQRYYS